MSKVNSTRRGTRPTIASTRPTSALFGNARSDEILRRLDLKINRRLDGLLQGDYQGLVPGHGSEPGETRAYQSGDDVRRIDWNVTARMQSTHIRETIADRELETWALIDMSASLEFGTADCEKRDLAIAAVAAIGMLTQRTGNRFGVVIADSTGLEVIRARPGRAHLLTTLYGLIDRSRSEQGSGPVDIAAAIGRLGTPGHRRGLAVVVSDFLSPGDWGPALRIVGSRHETLAVQVVDPRELELPPVGLINMVDPETGRRRQVQTSSSRLRTQFAEAARDQQARIAAEIRRAGADHLLLRTDRDWLVDIARFATLRRQRAGALTRVARPS